MENEKIDDQLNLALSIPQQLREKTMDLDVGYDTTTRKWELIVKYSGELPELADDINVVRLFAGYAIVTIPEDRIDEFAALEQVEFIEKPKNLFFAVNEGKATSCITNVQRGQRNLTGRNVLVAIIDSGERVIIMSS